MAKSYRIDQALGSVQNMHIVSGPQYLTCQHGQTLGHKTIHRLKKDAYGLDLNAAFF